MLKIKRKKTAVGLAGGYYIFRLPRQFLCLFLLTALLVAYFTK